MYQIECHRVAGDNIDLTHCCVKSTFIGSSRYVNSGVFSLEVKRSLNTELEIACGHEISTAAGTDMFESMIHLIRTLFASDVTV